MESMSSLVSIPCAMSGRPLMQHAITGEVVEGMEVLKAMERMGTTSGKPKYRVEIVDSGTI